ncbi:hypothetical protein DdX_14343 [Ditylenchus destructor]|uniref:Uncharacterized protein n=1 Tax=Ditylenchus destructor TaxID=166010 RepID=A0AAD4R205_9BILA|nr:hypothetical protein DdX_14343 [Ditylenchus destructor]
MEKNRGIIRELLKYEFELGHSVKEAIETSIESREPELCHNLQLMSGTQSLKRTKRISRTKTAQDIHEKSTEPLSSTLLRPLGFNFRVGTKDTT